MLNHGSFHATGGQVATFGRQLRKSTRDAGAVVRGNVRRDGSGRDLGYPGGRHRPPRFEEEWAAIRTGAAAAPTARGAEGEDESR